MLLNTTYTYRKRTNDMKLRNKYFTKINRLYILSIILFFISKLYFIKIFENYINEASTNNLALIFAMFVSYMPFFIDNNFSKDYVKRPEYKDLSKRQLISFIILVIFINCMSYLIINFLEHSFNEIGYTIIERNISGKDIKILSLLMQALIFAPIFEELIYRDFIFRKLNYFDSRFALIISSLLFALSHGNIGQFISSFILGMLLCYVYLITGSIKISIFLHMVNNFYTIFYNEVIFRYTNAFTRYRFLLIESIVVLILFLYAIYNLYKDSEINFELLDKKPSYKTNYRVYIPRITSFLVLIVSIVFISISIKKIGG